MVDSSETTVETTIDSADIIDRREECESCGALVIGRRFLQANGVILGSFCSEACLRGAMSEQRKRRWRTRRRGLKFAIIGLAVAGACLAPHEVNRRQRLSHATASPSPAAEAAARRLDPGWFGPEWPPTETSVLAALGRDAWIHPLAGPVRRMPRQDSRVFGAVRPGNRAVECRNGHCGVDLGGEIWGEHVRAVHDGVVEFVRRGANPTHGGQFVRIAHRGGTIFTQYFHLAAIPQHIERGVFVKSGDLIGLVGDTGVKESAPHLHFALSIRLSPEKPEKYVDPEPLMALWPLRVPIEDGAAGLVTTVCEPGVPLGSMPLIPGRKRRLAQAQMRKGGAAAAASSDTGKAAPADDSPPPEAAGSDVPGDE